MRPESRTEMLTDDVIAAEFVRHKEPMKAVCWREVLLSRLGGCFPREVAARGGASFPIHGKRKGTHGMKILALDLGKFKTVACVYVDGQAAFVTVETGRPEFTALLRKHAADVVVPRIVD